MTIHINIIYTLLAMVLLLVTGCNKTEWEYPDLSAEHPRILSIWPPKNSNGLPGEFNVLLGEEFVQQVIYTPTDHAECIWYLEGEEVAKGGTFSFTPQALGKYYIKVVVKTAEQQTFREAYLSVVNP